MTRFTDPEFQLQCAVAKWLDWALPPLWISTSMPAGGGGRNRGSMLKMSGLKTGWPDLLIFGPPTNIVAVQRTIRLIGIELKRPKGGTISSAQKERAQEIQRIGGSVYFCRSGEEVETHLRAEGLALRATFGDKLPHTRPILDYIDGGSLPQKTKRTFFNDKPFD